MVQAKSAKMWLVYVVILTLLTIAVDMLLQSQGLSYSYMIDRLTGRFDPEKTIDQADGLAVFPGIVKITPSGTENDALFESSNRRDLDALKASLQGYQRRQAGAGCFCPGNPIIVLYANGKVIGRIVNHHGKRINCPGWNSDADVPNVEAFLTWFDDRNIPGPRFEYENALQMRKEQEETTRGKAE